MPHFFITTAIDYTNAAPHIGHAYEKILADVLARFRRLKGDEVFFLTGVDQHGQKVQQSADRQGVAPQQFVDGITEKFRALWEKLDVRYDRWAATTDALHKDCVRKILQRLWDEKDETGASRWIYKDNRAGFYSVRQEQFLTDKERGADGEFGAEWGEVVFIEEENYYFRIAEHKQWLLDLIDTRTAQGRPLVTPEFRVAELRNAVEKISGDLCISRPKARLAWGIEFPFDAEFVTYVWFDALVNYLSFAPGYDPAPGADLAEFKCWWASVVHVIGKDILIPAHGIYWPIMLKALGFTDDEMPLLLVHGWWNVGGAKMSKSLGNAVDPDALADKYGAEALRYYLMRDISTGRDADFDETRLCEDRYNVDLANKLGNLLNRSLNMAQKYRGGVLRKIVDCETILAGGEPGGPVRKIAESLVRSYILCFNLINENPAEASVEQVTGMGSHVASALAQTVAYATILNILIEAWTPWKMAKAPAQTDRLDAVLYSLAESLRIVAILISPVLPKAAVGIFAQLNWDRPFALADAVWGGLPDGHMLGQPTPLFPRIETAPGK